MKKVILIILIVFAIMLVQKPEEEEQVIIPKEAIRFRVIPNSDEEADQSLKNEVKQMVQLELSTLLKDQNTLTETRTTIKDNLSTIENTVQNVLKNTGSNETYEINYGLNYFPDKEYKGVTYEEGYYESLVVTLGEGQGSNWWCVLFPPLCLLEAEETDQEEVEYKSFVKEVIDKFFNHET